MAFLASFTKTVPAAAFSRACLALSALWFVIVAPTWHYFDRPGLPLEFRGGGQDIYQYYAGGLAVRYGLWNSLYAIPRPEVYDQPNHFQPLVKTFLFNPEKTARDPNFYPELNDASDWTPGMLKYMPYAQGQWNYIYPPPTALLYYWMSFLTITHVTFVAIPTLDMWGLFALSFFASRIHRLLRGGVESYSEGLIVLACVIFGTFANSGISSGNVNPILSALTAGSCWLLARRQVFAFSCAYILLLLTKGIGLPWLIILLFTRACWRAFLYLAVFAAIFNGITLALAGPGIYQQYFALMPKITIPVGWGLVAGGIHILGFYPKWFYTAFDAACLACLGYAYWKNAMSPDARKTGQPHPIYLAMFFTGTMSLFCLTHNVNWPPYCACYTVLPFLGYLLAEGHLATGWWRRAILAGAIASFLLIMFEWFIYIATGHKTESGLPYVISRTGHVLLVPAFFLIVALRRALFGGPTEFPAAKPAAA